MKEIILSRWERVVAVVPVCVRGPGWSNQPAWVYIADNNGAIRSECVQPQEQSAALQILFNSGASLCKDLIDSVPTTTDYSK